MNDYAILLNLSVALVAFGFLIVAFNLFRHGNITLPAALLTLALSAPGTGVLGYWTAEAIQRPAPQEVTWESLAVNEDQSFLNKQTAWFALKTGWVTPEVQPGFFYSTAHFGEGEDRVELIGLPGYQQWFRLGSDNTEL